MPVSTLYGTTRWRKYRSGVLSTDSECALAHLAGDCLGALHVHHNPPLDEGGEPFPRENERVVLCARHHRLVHAWRRKKEPKRRTCPHNHRYDWARRECERRLNRQD